MERAPDEILNAPDNGVEFIKDLGIHKFTKGDGDKAIPIYAKNWEKLVPFYEGR